MDSNIIKAESSKIVLSVNDPSRQHEAGSEIIGRVYLTVANNAAYLHDVIKGINLVLEGQEYVEFPSNRDKVSRILHQYGGNQYQGGESMIGTLVRVDYPIASFSGQLQAGHYEFPFRCRLPEDMPGCMSYSQRKSNGVALIRYVMKAYVVNSQGFSVGCDESSSSVNIPVLAKPTSVSGKQLSMEQEAFPVYKHGVKNKGNIILGYKVSSNVVSPGSLLTASIVGYNASEMKVKRLVIRLVEKVSFMDGSPLGQTVSRTLVESELSVKDYPWWRRGKFLKPRALPPSNHQEIFHIRVPVDARDTFTGRLIQVRHELIVLALKSRRSWKSPLLESVHPITVARRSSYMLSENNVAPACVPPSPVVNDTIQEVPMATAVLIEEDEIIVPVATAPIEILNQNETSTKPMILSTY